MHLTCWIDFQKINLFGLDINLFSLDDVCVLLKSLRNSLENRRTVYNLVFWFVSGRLFDVNILPVACMETVPFIFVPI